MAKPLSNPNTELTISKKKEEIIKEAKRIEEGTLYSSKGHFQAAAFWRRLQFYLGLPTTLLASVLAAAAFSDLFPEKAMAGWISIVVAALSGLTTFLNPNETSASHFDAGNKYDALHNSSRIFWTIDCNGSDSDVVLTNKLKDLSEQKNELNRKSPQIPFWAYWTAKRGIEAGQAAYQVDKPKQ